MGFQNPVTGFNKGVKALGIGRTAKTSDAAGKRLGFAQYNAQGGGLWSPAYDVMRKLDPIDLLGNKLGFKDPIHGIAESLWTGITGTETSNVNRIRFDNANSATGFTRRDLGDEQFAQIYDTMSPDELAKVGSMTDQDQGQFLAKRWADIEAGTAKKWEDPNAPKPPPAPPDLTDAALAMARNQARQTQTGRGRRSTFLTGP